MSSVVEAVATLKVAERINRIEVSATMAVVAEAEKLRGDLKYGWIITVDSWKELIALRNGLKKAGRDFFARALPSRHPT